MSPCIRKCSKTRRDFIEPSRIKKKRRGLFLPYVYQNCFLSSLRLGSLVKYGEPVLTDPEVERAAQELPTVVDVLAGVARVFNTTFWRQVLCKLTF